MLVSGCWSWIESRFWVFLHRFWSLRSLLEDSNGNVIRKILKRTEMSRVVCKKAQRQHRDFYFHFSESVDPWTFEKCLQVNHLSLTAAFTSFPAPLRINHCGFRAHLLHFQRRNCRSRAFEPRWEMFQGFRVQLKSFASQIGRKAEIQKDFHWNWIRSRLQQSFCKSFDSWESTWERSFQIKSRHVLNQQNYFRCESCPENNQIVCHVQYFVSEYVLFEN